MKSRPLIVKESSACAEKLRVLADPTRLAVLRALGDGPAHVNGLMRLLNVKQSLLSHHLQALREAGLVVSQRDGKAVLYQLSPAADLSVNGGQIHLGCCQLSFDAD